MADLIHIFRSAKIAEDFTTSYFPCYMVNLRLKFNDTDRTYTIKESCEIGVRSWP